LKKFSSKFYLTLLLIINYLSGNFTVADDIETGIISQSIFGDTFTKSFNNSNSDYFEFNGDNETLRIIKYPITSQTAKDYISMRVALYQSVYEPQRVSYPGQYTRSIECPEKYIPKYHYHASSSESLSYFLGYANINKVAGACSDDLIAYKHLYGLLYCETKNTIFEIDFFTDTASKIDNLLIEKISCNSANAK